MNNLTRLLIFGIAIILIIGFLFINFITSLPLFLVCENLIIASLLTIGLILYFKKFRISSYILLITSLIYSGRISRSVISPEGNLQPLWEPHLIVVILLMILGFLSVKTLYKHDKFNTC